jgi:lysine 2,3-aminomutase
MRPSDPSSAAGWQAELRARVRTARELADALRLTDAEWEGACAAERSGLPIAVTRYYLGLCDPLDPACPIRRQVVPLAAEAHTAPGDLGDPLGECAHEVAPSLIRRYPDRALLLVTDRCATYCRFCTRRRLVGRTPGLGSPERLQAALGYLRAHPEVREVIVSGGDPLLLATRKLVSILSALRAIPTVEVIRLATRTPVVLPSRITEELLVALRPLQPLWVMTHFNHPKELTGPARAACARLVDAGFPVNNQTVLLRGVNDRVETLADLFRALVRARVRPYYLMQADVAGGTAHLRTPLGAGLEIMAALEGQLSGLALPRLVVDAPSGLGKVPLCADYVVDRRPGVTRLRTPLGAEVDYLDPPAGQ